jgi:hypothetical protein
VEDIRQFVVAVASTALPAELDDGLTFDLDSVTAADTTIGAHDLLVEKR